MATATAICDLYDLYDIYDELTTLQKASTKEEDALAASSIIMSLMGLAGPSGWIAAAATASVISAYGSAYFTSVKNQARLDKATVDRYAIILEGGTFDRCKLEFIAETKTVNGVKYNAYKQLKAIGLRYADSKRWTYID